MKYHSRCSTGHCVAVHLGTFDSAEEAAQAHLQHHEDEHPALVKQLQEAGIASFRRGRKERPRAALGSGSTHYCSHCGLLKNATSGMLKSGHKLSGMGRDGSRTCTNNAGTMPKPKRPEGGQRDREAAGYVHRITTTVISTCGRYALGVDVSVGAGDCPCGQCRPVLGPEPGAAADDKKVVDADMTLGDSDDE